MTEKKIEWRNLEKVLGEMGDFCVAEMRRRLDENGTNASRTLYEGMHAESGVTDDGFFLNVWYEDYGNFVEKGRGPGKFPPPDAIRKWVEIKPVSPTPMANGKVPSVSQLTFLISRKIAREGTEPRPFLEPAKEETLKRYEPLLEQAIRDDLDEWLLASLDG